MKKKILNCGIYKLENIINGKFYIGQSANLKMRKYNHFYELKNHKHLNTYIQNAFNLYGEENFIFKIVLYCEPEELTYYEQKCVDLWQPEYNIRKECVNSNLGTKMSEEIKYNLSKNHRDVFGKNNPFYGKHHTKDAKEKISIASIGNTVWLGRHHTEFSKRKISEHMSERSGENSWWWGVHHSDATKKKISESSKGKNSAPIEKIWIIKEMLIENFSIKAIRKITGFTYYIIQKVDNGGYKDIYGI